MAKLVIHSRAARYIERVDARVKAQLLAKTRTTGKKSSDDTRRKADGRGFIDCAMAICELSIFTIAPIKRLSSPMSVRAGTHTSSWPSPFLVAPDRL
jgi:hypothetical protein